MSDQAHSLDALGLRFGTDKASDHHDYLRFYESFFRDLRGRRLTILEVGVLDGASLRTWEHYFQQAQVIGIDVRPAARQHEGGRIKIEIADQSNIEELTAIAVKHGPFDIIVEDGSHRWDHQITGLKTLFPFVRNHGHYIVEDLQTNYGPRAEHFRGASSITCVDYLKRWLDLKVADAELPLEAVEDTFLRTYGRSVRFLTFYRRACIIQKDYNEIRREASAGRIITARRADAPYVDTTIVAHIGHLGDVIGEQGYLNSGSGANDVQGFSVNIKDHPELVEYRVRYPDGQWSDWARQTEFVGTRGQSMALTGFAVRLTDRYARAFSVDCSGLFGDSAVPVRVSGGRDCTSSADPLIGMQIDIVRL